MVIPRSRSSGALSGRKSRIPTPVLGEVVNHHGLSGMFGSSAFQSSSCEAKRAALRQRLERFVSERPWANLVETLGGRLYANALRHAGVMVGNSSSGIIEAASFKLQVVNIGARQEGRVRASNVVDVGYGKDEILQGIQTAVAPEFRNGLQDLENPYGDGTAADKIIHNLKTTKMLILLQLYN